mgnify:CR=1 FL=1
MVQSVERAFAILDAVSGHAATLTGVAERVHLPKSTVARLLQTLESLGAVERADGLRWRIGPRIGSLAATASPERSLVAVTRPHLTALVGALGEAAGLALPDGYEMLYVDQVESDRPVQVRDWTGTRAPMHAAPSGLVLLAEWPGEAQEAYIAHGLAALTARTVTDPAELRSRLVAVREAGFAIGREEFAEGISSVAAPVRDSRGQAIAAVHVHGPAYRFPASQREDEIVVCVRQAATAAGRELALRVA